MTSSCTTRSAVIGNPTARERQLWTADEPCDPPLPSRLLGTTRFLAIAVLRLTEELG
jgi:hypothetical protein